jgi:hypothetical protein
MYLPVPSQPNAALAWLAATQLVFSEPRHEAHNVIVDIEHPLICDAGSLGIIQEVDTFLRSSTESGGMRAKPLMTVANTIFPNAIYKKHGLDGLFKTFHDVLLPKIRRDCNWTGYYFERMTRVVSLNGAVINPLQDVIRRVKDPNVKAKNKFEISIFDPTRDISDSPYGGQCLSHLSFKLIGHGERKLVLTAIYRNHFYIEKLLGNLIGLSNLLSFVAKESGVTPGSLTIVSTHATAANQCDASIREIDALIKRCGNAVNLRAAA